MKNIVEQTKTGEIQFPLRLLSGILSIRNGKR